VDSDLNNIDAYVIDGNTLLDKTTWTSTSSHFLPKELTVNLDIYGALLTKHHDLHVFRFTIDRSVSKGGTFTIQYYEGAAAPGDNPQGCTTNMPDKITCAYSWDTPNGRHTFTGTATETITSQEI